MLKSNYKKIYSGNQFDVLAIVEKLHAIHIEAIVKDETESGRLAGFGSAIPGIQDVYVHNDEAQKAKELVDTHLKNS
ncbi:DUF2007 domain-containing protein [Cellulophaga sp. 20_2_10]|uniref:putative signal transducing protein n=1 Tax=Cellulophaga sp. 20_2_10 TaxID=2942476 RepID=UPI00201A46D6|nr:DUF2007 domain-containing protein [Cellulophaga sp. 20_2_10]MCL5245989.1 DUF2007 domain-containing protein [Cellulophaga sp. 20_2_10]